MAMDGQSDDEGGSPREQTQEELEEQAALARCVEPWSIAPGLLALEWASDCSCGVRKAPGLPVREPLPREPNAEQSANRPHAALFPIHLRATNPHPIPTRHACAR